MDVGNCLTECVFIVVSPSASRSLEANLTSAQLTPTSLSSIPDPSALSREGGRLWSSEASAVCTLGWRQKTRSFIRFQRYYPPYIHPSVSIFIFMVLPGSCLSSPPPPFLSTPTLLSLSPPRPRFCSRFLSVHGKLFPRHCRQQLTQRGAWGLRLELK